MDLFQHQEDGIDFMIDNAFGVANNSEMGTGKTVMAIVAMDRLLVDKVLIVCPNSLKNNWKKEIKKWSRRTHRVGVCDGSKPKKTKTIKDNNIVIINYESISNLEIELLKFKPELIIADEAHNIKNHKAKKTISLKKIPAKYKWIMTGTPTPNSPLDIWSQYDFIRPGHLGKNFYVFRAVYANVYTGGGFPMIKGYKNQDELRDKVDKFQYRALKDECLDLPEKIFQPIEIEMSQKTKKIYKDMLEEMVADIGTEQVAATTALTKMLRLQQITGGFITTEDGDEKDVGDEKLKALRDLLDSLAGEKVVVWARFLNEIKRIEALGKEMGLPVYVLRGDVEPEERQRRVDAFQSSDEPCLFVSSIAVGGAGITLTAARYAIYFSSTFSLGDRSQSLDRIHRIGQEHKVTYYDLVCAGTIDGYILDVLNKKQELSDHVTGDMLRRIGTGG